MEDSRCSERRHLRPGVIVLFDLVEYLSEGNPFNFVKLGLKAGIIHRNRIRSSLNQEEQS